MNDALEKLQHKLAAAQRALAEAESRYHRQETEYQSTIREADNLRQQIEQAHRQWISTLDAVEDPIFVHDRDFRVLRCNMAYQRCAGVPINEIIGEPYYKVFPKTHVPLPNCWQDLEKEEILVGETSYRSRAYSSEDGHGNYLYTVHILENINESKRVSGMLRESELRYRRLLDTTKDGILIIDAETGKVVDANPYILDLLSYSLSECTGKTLWEIGLFADVEASKTAFRELQSIGYIRYEDLPLQTKDGLRVDVEFVSNLYLVGERKVIQCNIRDITERNLAKQLLQASEMQYRGLFEAAQDGILILDAETGKIQDANPFILELLSYRLDECRGKMLWEIGLFKDIEASKEAFDELQSIGYIRYENLPLQTKDGREIEVEFVSNLYEVGERKVIQCNIRDITERIQTKARLAWRTAFFEALVKSSMDGILVVDSTGKKILQNQQMIEMWDIPKALAEDPDDTAQLQFVMSQTAEPDQFLDKVHYLYAHPEESSLDEIITKEGKIFDRYSAPVMDDTGIYYGRIWSFRDITERKRIEQTALEEKAFSDSLIKSLPDIFFLLDAQGRLLQWNKRLEELLGLSPQAMLGTNALTFIHEEDRPNVAEKIQQVFTTGLASVETRIVLKDGFRDYLLTGGTMETRLGKNLIGFGLDITERRAGELNLRRANRALQTLSAGNLALVRATNEDELLQAITKVIVKQAGYVQAAVDYANDDPERSITPKAWSGYQGDPYWGKHLSWADTEQGQLPISKAIRSGTTQVCHDITADPSFNPWREAMQAQDYRSNIALPLCDDGKTFGAMSIYSTDTDAFNHEEVRLLEELANDLAYGIISLRTRKEHEQHSVILRQSLEQSIETIADTVEARDPYTAGHQRRVAELATAIAWEMGLPEDQIHGIYLAGIIHDLGKIHVPAEILSKPGRLSDIEYMLIKQHPQDGYDILKHVKFPWPIADIILQHHERLDGSGYPQGLMGDAILLEAKILTVADVVEAMSSHRPYRAALGIQPALDEISRGRGSIYEPAVVDASLKLFSEEKFAFSSHPEE